MVSGKTASGFEFKIDEGIADDMEFMELLADAMEDAVRFPKVIEQLLGKDQKKLLYDHIRGDNGRVSIEKAIEEFTEIMNLAGEGLKNS